MENKEQHFSWYSNVYSIREEKRMTLIQIYELIKSGKLMFITKEIRRLTAEGRHKEARRMKMQLPAFVVAALFPEERKTEQAGRYTGYVLVDVDGMKAPTADYLERCKAFPWLALAYVSTRGCGVHLIFRVTNGTEQHAVVCRALQDMVETTLGEKVDRGCTDLVRTSLVCWDAECYFNPGAEGFTLERKSDCCPTTNQTTEAERLDRYLDRVDMGNSWVKGQRHGLLVSLAFCLNRAGFDQRIVESECLRRYAKPDFDVKEITKTIASVYTRAQAEHGANRREKPSVFPEKYATSANSASRHAKNDTLPAEETDNISNEDFTSHLPRFDKVVFEFLPALLRDMIRPGITGEEFDMALVGALTMLSTVTPNVYGQYHGRYTAPPLYLYVVAQAGSGKGILNTMRPAISVWQNYIYNQSNKRVKEYEKKDQNYLIAVAQAKRKGTPLTIDPPTVVRQINLNIPGSITQAKLTEVLAGNLHYPGLMHESEIGVLTDANSQDYGKYTNMLNKIAHQEEIGRDSVANKYQYCEKPLMGLLLSGTFGQFFKFIPSADDGLFSRFLAYTLDKPVEWKNLTDEDDEQSTGKYYPDLGQRILRAGLFLDQNATFVHYTKQQRDRMNARFRRLTEKAQLYGDNERQGIVNRLGHAHFRICMTLTALRKVEQQCTQENMLISDIDFNNAMEFILVFHEHILSLSTRLKKDGECPPATNPNIYEQIFNELPDEFRTADMTLRATSHGIAPRTSARRLKIWLDKELIFKLSAGKYIKKKQPEAGNQ